MLLGEVRGVRGRHQGKGYLDCGAPATFEGEAHQLTSPFYTLVRSWLRSGRQLDTMFDLVYLGWQVSSRAARMINQHI